MTAPKFHMEDGDGSPSSAPFLGTDMAEGVELKLLPGDLPYVIRSDKGGGTVCFPFKMDAQIEAFLAALAAIMAERS